MMKNTLFICNTYYQLIVAIQMKLTSAKEDNSYILMTDQSKDAKTISKNLKEANIFKDVFFQQTPKQADKTPSMKERLFYVKSAVFGNKKYCLDKNVVFDRIIGFNFDIHSHIIYANEYKKNKNIICEKMEEGILSYDTRDDSSGVLSTIYKIRKFLKMKNMREIVADFHCFLPELYSGKLKTVSIPKICTQDSQLKSILFQTFYVGKKSAEYKEKYIYLPCIYDFEGGEPIGELELAISISKIVGVDNLLVKVHPRDNKERYKNAGLKVDENSSIPWEAIQIYNDFSDKVIISTLSSSLLATASLFDNPPKCFYMFESCNLNSNQLATYYSNVIKKFLLKSDEYGFKNIFMCNDLNDLLNIG